MPSPPFRPLPSSQGRRWLYTPWRRVNTTLATINHFTTNSLQLSHYRRPLPLPVLQPSRCRRPLPQPVYSHRAADDPYYDQCTAGTADAPQTQTQTQTQTTTIIPRFHNTKIPFHRRWTVGYCTIDNYYNIGILQMRR